MCAVGSAVSAALQMVARPERAAFACDSGEKRGERKVYCTLLCVCVCVMRAVCLRNRDFMHARVRTDDINAIAAVC